MSPSDDPWTTPATVSGFAASAPNASLMAVAEALRPGLPRPRALDIGCGAGRNAVPLARSGWHVLGIDQSWPMLQAAHARRTAGEPEGRLHLAQGRMDRLPAAAGCFDLIVAHGIWNLATRGIELRRAVQEAARAATAAARLFVFTFSRTSLASAAVPVTGEPFVFTDFSGRPQTFLTAEELVDELARAGFVPDERHPLRELNRPAAGALAALAPPPVIWEGLFRRAPPDIVVRKTV